MDGSIRTASWIAVLIHMGVVALVLLVSYIMNLLNPPQPLVFELVMAAAAPAPAADEPTEPAPMAALEGPRPEPLRPLPRLPDPPPPAPVPQPTPVETPPPQRELINIDDFRRDRNVPERVQTTPAPRPRSTDPVPQIDTRVRDRMARHVAPVRLQGIDLSDLQDRDAMSAYLAALSQRIQETFVPSGSGLEAEAMFTVTAAGLILNARIGRSSGDRGFDASVLRSIAAVRTPGPPPGNRSYDFSLVFRSE